MCNSLSKKFLPTLCFSDSVHQKILIRKLNKYRCHYENPKAALMSMLLRENAYRNQEEKYITFKSKITNLNIKLDLALK